MFALPYFSSDGLGVLLKILIVSVFKEGFGGGEGQMAFELGRALSERHDVALVCTGSSTRLIRESGSFSVLLVGSEMEGEVASPYWGRRNLKTLIDFVDGFGPDVIHGNDAANTDVILQDYANRHGIPYIYTGHSMPSRMMEFVTGLVNAHVVTWAPQKAVAAPYLKGYFSGCDRIVALNRVSYDDHRRYVNSDRLAIIPNLRDMRKFALKKTVSPLDPVKRIVFVGTIVERKNQMFLIEALRSLPSSVELLLLGDVLSKPYLRKIRAYIKKYDMKNVTIGRAESAEIPRYLRDSHLFVSASLAEVQSLAVIEALASATPVVGLENETISELIDGKNGVSLPQTAEPEEFAAEVARLLELSPSRYAAMSAYARTSVELFDKDAVLDLFEAMYEECIRERLSLPVARNRWSETMAAFWITAGKVSNDFVVVARRLAESAIVETIKADETRTEKPKFKLRFKSATK
jgi:glycosyltransferase involved in cell wall biosynthesis